MGTQVVSRETRVEGRELRMGWVGWQKRQMEVRVEGREGGEEGGGRGESVAVPELPAVGNPRDGENLKARGYADEDGDVLLYTPLLEVDHELAEGGPARGDVVEKEGEVGVVESGVSEGAQAWEGGKGTGFEDVVVADCDMELLEIWCPSEEQALCRLLHAGHVQLPQRRKGREEDRPLPGNVTKVEV